MRSASEKNFISQVYIPCCPFPLSDYLMPHPFVLNNQIILVLIIVRQKNETKNLGIKLLLLLGLLVDLTYYLLCLPV